MRLQAVPISLRVSGLASGVRSAHVEIGNPEGFAQNFPTNGRQPRRCKKMAFVTLAAFKGKVSWEVNTQRDQRWGE